MLLSGRGKLLRIAPIELRDALLESMAVLGWRSAKFYVRTPGLPVGNG
jgi:hypothetical protein